MEIVGIDTPILIYLLEDNPIYAAKAATIFERSTGLKTPDAIHLATAQLLEGDLARLITYDERLSAAAQAIGCTVVAPS